MSDYPIIHWNEDGAEQSARWRSESGMPPPKLIESTGFRPTPE